VCLLGGCGRSGCVFLLLLAEFVGRVVGLVFCVLWLSVWAGVRAGGERLPAEDLLCWLLPSASVGTLSARRGGFLACAFKLAEARCVGASVVLSVCGVPVCRCAGVPVCWCAVVWVVLLVVSGVWLVCGWCECYG
jgi:hypothetical protein